MRSKGQLKRFPNDTVTMEKQSNNEKTLESSNTGKDATKKNLDFTPPSFDLFSQSDDLFGLDKVLKLPIAQPTDAEKADETIQQNDAKKGKKDMEKVQKNAEESSTENVNTKRPKVTIKVVQVQPSTTAGNKGKQLVTPEDGSMTPADEISAVPIRYLKLGNTNDNQVESEREVRQKRERVLSGALLSPYVKRKVSITNNLQADEKPVVEFIFSGTLPANDIVFKTMNMEVPRVVFESMHESLPVTSVAIDVWSIIQNNDEKLKNRVSSHFLFCKTGMMLSRKPEDFKRKMDEVLEYSTKKNLDKVELVFFPITMPTDEINRYYLIVYNLKTMEVDIIDNMHDDSQDIHKRYGDTPKALTRTFALYLHSVEHPTAAKITTAKHKIMKLEWETRLNRVDSGIFLMRHMETFFGRKKEFNSGLKKDSVQQQNHITGLRKKYVVKMLMTIINEKRQMLEQESKRYISFNEAHKSNLHKTTFQRLQPRVKRYYDEHEEKLKKKWSFLNKFTPANNMM